MPSKRRRVRRPPYASFSEPRGSTTSKSSNRDPMPITDEKEAAALADRLAAEMVAALEPGMLAEAKVMGMATSVFAAELEKYRAKFNAQVAPELAMKELFDVAASRLLME